MRTSVYRRLMSFPLVGVAILIVCSIPNFAMTTDYQAALHLADGRDWIYFLDEIETIFSEGDQLYVVTTSGNDGYSLESLVRIEFLPGSSWVGVDGPGRTPSPLDASHLFQNRPNPFSPETHIAFELPLGGRAELQIYDVRGRLIRTLLDAKRPAGLQSVRWDGRDETGRAVASGVYFYSLTAPGVDENRRMILVK